MSDRQINWNEIRGRLESAKAAIDKEYSPGAEETKRILKARAGLLAREPEGTPQGEHIETVEFLLSNERYGIDAHYVREVYPLKDYTPLPCTPSFVLGLLNVRGQIVSVIDIRKFFDMPEEGISDLNKVIIVHNDTMEFGILVDSILGVRNIAESDIRPAPPTLIGIREEFLKGVTGDRIAILDAKKLLADKNVVVHEEV